MAEAAWGTVTAKGGGGGQSDPNVLALGDHNKVRILEPKARKWRQHGVQSPTDSEQFRSVICPRGPEGRDPGTCPLCMKPVDSEGNQRFAISRRFAVNVWDYESGSVKVLIGGPQIFDEFDAFAQVGQDPTKTDWIIFKSGEKKQTTYKVVPVPGEAPVQVTEDMLHDLDKYDEAPTVEKIFETLEALGIDYDALEMPSYSLEDAEKMQMPYGKHKGMTLEQLYANEKDYMQFLHGKKLEQGQLGDPIFVAFQTILEHYGDVGPLEAVAAPAPKPASSPSTAPQSTPPATDAGMITLLDQTGTPGQFPEAAKDALLAAGYTEPAPPEPEPVPETTPGMVMLRGLDGEVGEYPEAAVAALLDAGYQPVGPAPTESPSEPVPARTDSGEFILTKDGQDVSVPEAAVDAMLSAGYVYVFEGAAAEQSPDQTGPSVPEPGDADSVQFKLSVMPAPIPMAWKDAKRLFLDGQGDFTDENAESYRYYAQVGASDATPTAADAQADPNPPGGSAGDPFDPALTEQRDGEFFHPAIELGSKGYKTKGGVTQALNRLKKQQEAAGATPTNGNGGAAKPAASGKDGLMEQARDLLKAMPDLNSDFDRLMSVFEEVSGKRNISEFDESELTALIAKLEEIQAAA